MLSKKTKYALHALTFLGKKQASTPILIAEISKECSIPKKFLETILLELKQATILGSKMGKGGGYFLRFKPSDIKLSQVIRMFNGPIALLPCASKNYYQPCDECENESNCGLKSVMEEVRDETLKILENKTIQDIINKESIN